MLLGIAVDATGEAAIAGWGLSGGGINQVVAKLSATGSSLIYSHVFSGFGEFTAIAVDNSGAAYVTGYTLDSTFPLFSPIQGYSFNPLGASPSALVAKFDAFGSTVWATFLGSGELGGAVPGGIQIAADSAGAAYVLGFIAQTTPITPNALQPQPGGSAALGGSNNFLAKIAPSLGAPVSIVSPNSVPFGNQIVGQPSATADISVGNFGDAPMSASISVTGDFSQTNTCASPVAGGRKCDINVVFTPTVLGNRTGTLTVNFGGTIPAQTVALAGTGVASGVGLAPGSLTFPPQAIGTTSSTQQIVVTNTGTGSLTITAVQTTGDFAATNTCGAPIAPGSNCLVRVTFTPTLTGTRNGALTLVDNAASSPQTVTLTGTGSNASSNPSVTMVPASLAFTSQQVGTASPAQQVVVTNSGTGPLTIYSLQAKGDYSYSNANACGTPIAPGNGCAVQVTFTPTALGARNGILSVADNAPGTPQTMTLSGGAVSLGLAVPSGSSSAVTVKAGGTASYTLSIGGAAFAGTASFSCTGTPLRANCSVPAPIPVDANTAATFNVTVTTTSSTIASLGLFRDFRISWIFAAALLGIFIRTKPAHDKSAVRRMLLMVSLVFLLLWSSGGCGAPAVPGSTSPQPSPNGTPAGTYNLTVTATSGSVIQSMPLTLTVQ